MKLHQPIRDLVYQYVDGKLKGKPATESVGGYKYTIDSHGRVYVNNHIAAQVINPPDNTAIPSVIVNKTFRATTLCHEIPVAVLSGDDMHDKNYKFFHAEINGKLSEKMSLVPRFIIVLSIRRGANEYAKHFGLPPLPMTEKEINQMSRAALLGEEGGDRVDQILAGYRKIYNIPDDVRPDQFLSSTQS